MKTFLFTSLLAICLLAYGPAAEARTRIVIANGTREVTEDNDSEYAKGTFRIYSQKQQKKIRTIKAFDEFIGVQVAVGDVDGDDTLEIVAIPVKPGQHEWKVFSLRGELEASGTIPEFEGEHELAYHIAVGNINKSKKEEIVLSNALNAGLVIDVLKLKNGSLERIGYYASDTQTGYTHASRVTVGNLDTSTKREEIISSPLRGDAMLNVWDFHDGEPTHVLEYRDIEAPEGYPKGLHVAVHEGELWALTHGPTEEATRHVWDEDTASIITTGDRIEVPSVSSVAYNGKAILYGTFNEKQAVKKKNNGDQVYKITTKALASTVDFIPLP